MSAARIDRLKSLLARVQERKAAPKLRQVPTAAREPALAARSSGVPSEAFALPSAAPKPASLPPAATLSLPTVTTDPAWGAAKTLPDLRQASTNLRESTSPSVPELTLGDALTREPLDLPQPVLDLVTIKSSAPAAYDELPEPTTLPPQAEARVSVLPAIEARPATDAKETKPDFEPIFESEPPTSATVTSAMPVPAPLSEPAPFEAGRSAREQTNAPSMRLDAPPISRAEPVVRAISAPRVEGPKSFGDLLEVSLSLRTR